MAKKLWTRPVLVILAVAGQIGCGGTPREEPGAFLASHGDLATTLLDLGHIIAIDRLYQSGDRVLSVGGFLPFRTSRWILWDRVTRTQLCDGVVSRTDTAQLTSSTVLVQSADTLEFRSAVDCHTSASVRFDSTT